MVVVLILFGLQWVVTDPLFSVSDTVFCVFIDLCDFLDPFFC